VNRPLRASYDVPRASSPAPPKMEVRVAKLVSSRYDQGGRRRDGIHHVGDLWGLVTLLALDLWVE